MRFQNLLSSLLLVVLLLFCFSQDMLRAKEWQQIEQAELSCLVDAGAIATNSLTTPSVSITPVFPEACIGSVGRLSIAGPNGFTPISLEVESGNTYELSIELSGTFTTTLVDDCGSEVICSFFIPDQIRALRVACEDECEEVSPMRTSEEVAEQLHCVSITDPETGEPTESDEVEVCPGDEVEVVDMQLTNANGQVLSNQQVTVVNGNDPASIQHFFTEQFFLEIPIFVIGEDAFQLPGDNENQFQANNFEVHDLAELVVSFTSATSTGLSLEQKTLDEFLLMQQTYNVDDNQAFITKNSNFCDPDSESGLQLAFAEFTNPDQPTYWIHIWTENEEATEGILYINSSIPQNCGPTSNTAEAKSYYNYLLDEVDVNEFGNYGFDNYDDHLAFIKLDLLSSAAFHQIDPTRSRLDVSEEGLGYACDDNVAEDAIYVSPSGRPVVLPAHHIANFSSRRFSGTAFDARALTGFTLLSGSGMPGIYTGYFEYSSTIGEIEFLGYRLYKARWDFTDVVYESIELSSAPATHEVGFGRINYEPCPYWYTEIKLTGYQFAAGLDYRPRSNGLFIAQFGLDGVGEFTADIPIDYRRIYLCQDEINASAWASIMGVDFQPDYVDYGQVGNPETGWLIEVVNAGNEIERIFGTTSTVSPGEFEYYRYRCNGQWESFIPPTQEHLDFISAFLQYVTGIEFVHQTLDALGVIPILGEPADVLNGVIYSLEGNVIEATLSFATVVPLISVIRVGDELVAVLKTAGNARVYNGYTGLRNVNAQRVYEYVESLRTTSQFQSLSRTEADQLIDLLSARFSNNAFRHKYVLDKFLANPNYTTEQMVGAYSILAKAYSPEALASSLTSLPFDVDVIEKVAELGAMHSDLLARNLSNGIDDLGKVVKNSIGNCTTCGAATPGLLSTTEFLDHYVNVLQRHGTGLAGNLPVEGMQNFFVGRLTNEGALTLNNAKEMHQTVRVLSEQAGNPAFQNVLAFGRSLETPQGIVKPDVLTNANNSGLDQIIELKNVQSIDAGQAFRGQQFGRYLKRLEVGDNLGNLRYSFDKTRFIGQSIEEAKLEIVAQLRQRFRNSQSFVVEMLNNSLSYSELLDVLFDDIRDLLPESLTGDLATQASELMMALSTVPDESLDEIFEIFIFVE